MGFNKENIMKKFINGQPVELTTMENNELLNRQSDARTTADTVLAFEIRQIRNELLDATDWAVCRALETGALFQELKDYRQALRDITAQEGFPSDVIWPVAPKF